MTYYDKSGNPVTTGFYFHLDGETFYLDTTGDHLIAISKIRKVTFKQQRPAEVFTDSLIRVSNPRELSNFLLSDPERLRRHDGDFSREEPPLSSRRQS